MFSVFSFQFLAKISLMMLSNVELRKNSVANQLLEPLLTNCKNLLRTIFKTQIEHIYCEANYYADALVKLSFYLSCSFVHFDNPLPMIENLLPQIGRASCRERV